MFPSLALLALAMAQPAFSQSPGSIVQVGNTIVSAMMMFLGNDQKVYIMDKVEGNAVQIGGHPAWASVWDIESRTAEPMDFRSNSFCASGFNFPNGSWATFGGNGAIAPGGNIGSVLNPDKVSAAYDASYDDYDGAKAIRILNPCTGTISATDTNCQWFDNAALISMQKKRWYSTAEGLADGSIVLIGGFVNGGYINRNYPNVDPETEGGAAEPTYEFYPSKGDATVMQFMIKTSGLNSYPHAFTLASGNMFVQANVSTMVWDWQTNTETPLPDMPGGVARVYPASGAVAMLPMTIANNYTQTMIFCGGSDMPDAAWGDYSWPYIDTWNYPASNDCQRITPEPADGSAPVYVQDDDMFEGRTMGQFIILPTGKLVVLNGGVNGTAGYATRTLTTPLYGDMPNGMSLASGPVGTPALYDPDAPAGSRWTNKGFGTSTIPRLYHSSALLLPDASIMIAGSNPNVDVNLTTVFPTTYTAEIFYPPYFGASTRPAPSGLPTTISYGGPSFDITIPASSYSGAANDAADNTTVVLIRPGWTTHAMNMGQRFLQLNNTYTVNQDGSIVLHTAQAPPNANLITPGPVLIFVVVNGIPSNGTTIILGNGQIGTQPTAPVAQLPPSVRLASASGSGSSSSVTPSASAGSGSSGSSGGSSHTGAIAGGVIGGIAIVGIIGAIIGVMLARRRRAARVAPSSLADPSATLMRSGGPALGAGAAMVSRGPGPQYSGLVSSTSSGFAPLALHQQGSTASLAAHVDGEASPRASSYGGYGTPTHGTSSPYDQPYDPYHRDDERR